ncbi:hypothetical protein EIP91_007318 [Steccherinum ochraceum]|uniref:Uncharacterized protein n=1 Tax=Steccherinum ochraceum TaxID=92696 RepID=A0A4R0RRX5_9APHY|nr:hypothetical protein EIP91_007318 [Steccherinum ochraceum]
MSEVWSALNSGSALSDRIRLVARAVGLDPDCVDIWCNWIADKDSQGQLHDHKLMYLTCPVCDVFFDRHSAPTLSALESHIGSPEHKRKLAKKLKVNPCEFERVIRCMSCYGWFPMSSPDFVRHQRVCRAVHKHVSHQVTPEYTSILEPYKLNLFRGITYKADREYLQQFYGREVHRYYGLPKATHAHPDFQDHGVDSPEDTFSSSDQESDDDSDYDSFSGYDASPESDGEDA